MTEDDEEEQMTEISYGKYRRLLNESMQTHAEGWLPVLRHDSGPIEARPVDRQDDRDEGEYIDTEQWLIREDSGETYTVSDDVFEERYDMQNEYRTERYRVDLSWDSDDVEAPDDAPEGIEVAGWTIVAEMVAHIHVPTQSVQRLEIERASLEQSNHQNMDGIPIELLKDSPDFSYIADKDDE